jgi:hypothetical protein
VLKWALTPNGRAIPTSMRKQRQTAAVGDNNNAAVGEDTDADTPVTVSASKAKCNKRSNRFIPSLR